VSGFRAHSPRAASISFGAQSLRRAAPVGPTSCTRWESASLSDCPTSPMVGANPRIDGHHDRTVASVATKHTA
jgi:hypothetical protein